MADFNTYKGYQDPTQGLMGLPHFSSSRISKRMMEPVYQNLFTVDIDLPLALTDGANPLITNDDKKLLLESVTKVGGLDTHTLPAGGVEQKYKWAERHFANSGPDKTSIDLSLSFEVNLRYPDNNTTSPEMFQVRMLRMWSDLIYDPLTGGQCLKVEYVAPKIDIVMHDRKGNPFWVWRCYDVFPTAKLPVPQLEYNQKGSIYKVENFTLKCDWWEEAMLV